MADKVIIVPYDPQWPELFAQVGRSLRETLGETAQRIDHIGSTAISGLGAKPIIDIQISVADLAVIETYRIPIESLGYIFRADNPERTKRYFREAPGQQRTHIHVRRIGSWGEQFALLFRDYLRVHAEDMRQYGELKYRLAKEYGKNRLGYTKAKEPLIWAIMQRADQWSQKTGWEPGFTDK